MRDIRTDLQERLQAIDAEISNFKARLTSLEDKRRAVRALIEAEGELWPQAEGAEIQPSKLVTTKKLSDLALELFAQGEEWSGEAIAAYAVKQGFDFNGSSPKRVTHTTLVGMARSGLIDGLGQGRWRFHRNATQ